MFDTAKDMFVVAIEDGAKAPARRGPCPRCIGQAQPHKSKASLSPNMLIDAGHVRSRQPCLCRGLAAATQMVPQRHTTTTNLYVSIYIFFISTRCSAYPNMQNMQNV